MNSDYREQVGHLLRKRRAELGLKQWEVAEKLRSLGVDVAAGLYGHWERGRRAILADYLPALAVALELTDEDLRIFTVHRVGSVEEAPPEEEAA